MDDEEVMDVLVFELEVFLAEGSSRVALESVEVLMSSSGRLAVWGLLCLAVVPFEGLTGAGASESLLEELELDDDAGRALFAGVWSSESLDDEDSLEDEEELTADFWGDLFGADAAAAEDCFLTGVAFVFFAGGASASSDDDESDSESVSELDDSLELAFRFSLLVGLLVVGVMEGSLAPGASFSSSASLSELVLDVDADDADDDFELITFFIGFEAEACFLVNFDVAITSSMSTSDPLSSLLLPLLPLLLVTSASTLALPFSFLLFFGCLTCTVASSAASSLLVSSSFALF